MDISMIITLAMAGFMLILALVNLLMSLKKHWIISLIRLGVTLAAAVIAVPVTHLFADLATDTVYGWLLPLMGEEIGGFLTEVPVGAEGLRVIASLVAAPIVYFFVFIVIRLVMSVVPFIIRLVVPGLKKKRLRLVSMALGAVNGLAIAVVALIPICGFLMLGSSVLHTFVEGDMADTAFVRENILVRFGITEDDVEQLAESLDESPVIAGIHNTVGKPVFTYLTTAELDSTDTHGQVIDMNLEGELCGLLKTAGYAAEVMGTFEKENYTAEDKEVLFAMADSLFSSEWVKMLSTDTVVALSENWIAGEEFAGMARPKLDASLNPTLNTILTLLSSENGDTLEADIHVILDVVGDLLVNDLMSDSGDYTAMVQKMGASGLLTDMLAKLEVNDRMHALAAELKALSIRLVTNMLGTDLLKDGEYANMLGSVAGTLTDALSMSKEERDALVIESIQNNFKDSGFDVPPEVALEMSDQIMEDLGADGEISLDELTDYMVNHAEDGFDMMGDVEIPEELPDLQP